MTLNGLVRSAALNGATGIVHEPAVDDADHSPLVVRVSFPGGERMIRAKQSHIRAVTRAPEYSRIPMTPIDLNSLLPSIRKLSGPRAVLENQIQLCSSCSSFLFVSYLLLIVPMAGGTFTNHVVRQAHNPALSALQQWCRISKQNQTSFSAAAPWTMPHACKEAVSICLLTAEGEVERQMVNHFLSFSASLPSPPPPMTK